MNWDTLNCCWCGDDVEPPRWELGYRVCLVCGEEQAKKTRHTVVPMSKSNYVVVTDYSLLKGLNKYENPECPPHRRLAPSLNK